jgi:hypothetical protein
VRVDVVLPAGGRLSGEFAAEAGSEVKALLTVGGQTLLERALRALRDTGRVDRAVVVGPDAVREHPAAGLADVVLPEGASAPENVLRGIDWLAGDGAHAPSARVLVMTTDLPLAHRDAVLAFLERCPPDADLCVPIVRAEHFQGSFPTCPNTYVPLRDGEWTLGGIFLASPAALAANRAHLERVFQARKSRLRMATLLGPVFLARYLSRRLTVPDIELRCRQILRCSGAAVPLETAELAFDIDLIEHLRCARELAGGLEPAADRDSSACGAGSARGRDGSEPRP